MNKKFTEKDLITRFLLLFCILGISTCFAAADLGQAAETGFFKVLSQYITPIVVVLIGIATLGMIAAHVPWTYALSIGLVGVIGWVLFSDQDTVTNIIAATKTLGKSFLN